MSAAINPFIYSIQNQHYQQVGEKLDYFSSIDSLYLFLSSSGLQKSPWQKEEHWSLYFKTGCSTQQKLSVPFLY